MTRVLLVYQPTDGGVGRHVADLAIGLTDRGHEVVLCGPAAPERCRKPELRICQLNLGRAITPGADVRALRTFGRIVHDVQPDIVHAHSSKAGAIGRIGRLAHPRTPVLYTPHGYAFAGHFSREAERLAYREIERVLARLTTQVICVCEAEARLARSIGPVDRVSVVYNGIEPRDSKQADERILELARQGPVICAVTLLRPGKGLETLIDAMPMVLTRYPTAQVAVVGDGPDLEALRARAQARSIIHAVHFLGSSPDPPSVMCGATIFVHPSLAEAFPYVILEAMSAGLPIVASDVGGIGEALVDGQSGRLVAPGNPGLLASALIDLLANPDRAARMGVAAKQRMHRLFTRAQMVDGIARVYEASASRPHTS